MFTLIYEKRFLKDLDKIPNVDVDRIVRVVKGLAYEPMPKNYKKLKTASEVLRIRQGDYRIIYQIDVSSKQVRVLCVRHRKDVYKNIP